MLRLLCIRGARDVPCHAACSGRPHPYPTLARYRWALVPACCLLHGCITGDVPLLSSGEANFKYHKHNNTLKETLSAVPNVCAPEGAPSGSGQLARRSWGERLGHWASSIGRSTLTTTYYLHTYLTTHLLTGTTTRWASSTGRFTRSTTSSLTRCPSTRVRRSPMRPACSPACHRL